jgi:hypothetical protein
VSDTCSEQDKNNAKGHFWAFPVSIGDIGSERAEVITIPSPWDVPLMIGIYGTSGSLPEPTLWLALEQEIPWIRPGARLDREIMELMHAQRFAADCRGSTGVEPYAAIAGIQNDPPDFYITHPDGSRGGLECVSFSIEERRGAQSLFRNIKNKLAFQQRHRTGHLTGCSVLVWLGKDQNPNTRPPRKNDDAAAEELIEALSQYRPDIDGLRIQFSSGMPPQMPPLVTGCAPQDATFYAVPMLSSIPVVPQGLVKVASIVQPGERPVRSRIRSARRGSWAIRRVSAV